MKWQIRRAKEADYVEFERLAQLLHASEVQGLPETLVPNPETYWHRGTFINSLEDKNDLLLVAQAGDQLIGMLWASFEHDGGDEIMLPKKDVSVYSLYVDKVHRRQGAAKALLAEAEGWAKKKKAQRLTVVAYGFAEEAHSLYKGLGYKLRSVRYDKSLK